METISKISYEDACELLKRLTQASAFRKEGVDIVLERAQKALEEVGWSFALIAEEGQRRMLESMAKLQQFIVDKE